MEMPVVIGVSACLLGQQVRYDGRDKRHAWLCDGLAREFVLEPICPEVAIGMGVPRAPIRLVAYADRVRAQGVDDPELDVTLALDRYAAEVAQRLGNVLAGYVFKSGSPSCGVRAVPCFGPGSSGGEALGTAAGIFAAALRARLPGLPVLDEGELSTPADRLNFVARVRACVRERSGSDPVPRRTVGSPSAG